MKLGAFIHPTGNHLAAWLHPEATIDGGTNVGHYIDLARTAERGKFDLLFLADAVATRSGDMAALAAIHVLLRSADATLRPRYRDGPDRDVRTFSAARFSGDHG